MDLRKVKTLIDLVQQSDISELEIQEGEERVRISRGPIGMVASGVMPAGMPQVMAAPTLYQGALPAGAEAGAPVAPAAEVPAEPQGYVLKSPMVGTFYRSSAPGSKPFVDVGQTVKADETVCIIEAMKLLNEIEGGADGVIKEILVENGQPVEYGQPLMVIA
jgi:acetyl-CoA carboxylase biotin carboxyl carrier protein